MAPTRARPRKQATEQEVLATAHDLAVALHRVGALDALDMRAMDRLCLPPRPEYGSTEIRRIRAATPMSQPVFCPAAGGGQVRGCAMGTRRKATVRAGVAPVGGARSEEAG
jgi:hypothetical protein